MPHGAKVFHYCNDELIPEFARLSPKNMLYIGWRSDCSPWWYTHFIQNIGVPLENVTILEIYAGNFEDAKRKFQNVVHGDARKVDELFTPGQFDIVFWDHGPEHVSTDDLVICTPKLSSIAGKLLLYCCPWGDWPQGAEGGNVHEIHYPVSDNVLEHGLGMKVVRFGSPGQESGGELIAYLLKT